MANKDFLLILIKEVAKFVDFRRAMLYAANVVMRCSFVCLSRSYILSKRVNIFQIFHRRVATPF